ncbi:MAG: hypothetical protein U0271_41185 [Polyangiaceae bacterium]
MASTYSHRIGGDENGLGPRLGPMLTTAVLARADERGHKYVERGPRGKLAERLGDSKALVAHGDIALGEAWARAVVAHTTGVQARSVRELVHALSLDAEAELVRPCPSHVEEMCWARSRTEELVAEQSLVDTLSRDLDALARSGVEVLRAESAIVCTRRLNDAVERGLNRFLVDLHAMERLTLSLRERAGAEVLAVLGKVGGLTKYEPAFGPLSGRLCTVLEEKRERSAYRFPGVGELRFVMDADASDLLVAMSSLIGKYLREALMANIVVYWQRHKASLPTVSGYHDPITAEFVSATRLLRKKQKVPDACFERRKVEAIRAEAARESAARSVRGAD